MSISTKQVTPKCKIVITKAGSRYNPNAASAQNNADTWATLSAALQAGPQTYGDLMALAKKEHNHAPFVGYAVRRGWLATK